MAFKHGKDTVFKVNAVDLSAFTTSSEISRGADEHDVTGYGKSAHVVQGGLLKGSFSAEGTYDSTATTGPRDALKDLPGTNVTVIRQPEGTGSSKPQDSFTALITEYVETNPVADMIKWSVKGTISDTINDTAQSA